jgi:hypothetical protein
MEYDFTVLGRDFRLSSVFEQFMYVDKVKLRLNTYNTSVLARWTDMKGQRVYIRMKK